VEVQEKKEEVAITIDVNLPPVVQEEAPQDNKPSTIRVHTPVNYKINFPV
jgi:biopolymer transport protein ExbD